MLQKRKATETITLRLNLAESNHRENPNGVLKRNNGKRGDDLLMMVKVPQQFRLNSITRYFHEVLYGCIRSHFQHFPGSG